MASETKSDEYIKLRVVGQDNSKRVECESMGLHLVGNFR